jgi:arylsulfatase A-like enzyme
VRSQPSRLWLLAALLLAIGCRPDSSAGPVRPDSPSIVVITIDTLRADHLGCYGYFRNTSPTIDALAAESVLFTRAMTTMATTLPAHLSLWTSRMPLDIGVTKNGWKVFEREETESQIRLFAEMLKDLGYTTAAFVSANPVKSYTGIDAGFDTFIQPRTGAGKKRERADRTNRAVLEWLDSQPAEPFFLWVHFFDPHRPYSPPAPFDTAFADSADLQSFLESRPAIVKDRNPAVINSHNMYDGEILFVDSEIEKLLQSLKDKQLFDDLALVLASDHGEALGEHGRFGHGEIHNEQLHVPLMIKYPSKMGLNGRQVDSVVSLTDVVPTLVATLDLDLPQNDLEQFVGVNVLSSQARDPYAFVQRSTARGRSWGTTDKFALVGDKWKFSYDTKFGDTLVDLEADPYETQNVIAEHPEVARELKDRLLEMIAEYSSSERGFQLLDSKSSAPWATSSSCRLSR